MGITKNGIEGEQKLFKLLKAEGFKFFQPDAIGSKDGKYYLFEVKHQEYFEGPPFDGHGLPKWQVEARLKFEDVTGIQTILVIFDKKSGKVYWQLLRNLDAGDKTDTSGLNPRRIYPLDAFMEVTRSF